MHSPVVFPFPNSTKIEIISCTPGMGTSFVVSTCWCITRSLDWMKNVNLKTKSTWNLEITSLKRKIIFQTSIFWLPCSFSGEQDYVCFKRWEQLTSKVLHILLKPQCFQTAKKSRTRFCWPLWLGRKVFSIWKILPKSNKQLPSHEDNTFSPKTQRLPSSCLGSHLGHMDYLLLLSIPSNSSFDYW